MPKVSDYAEVSPGTNDSILGLHNGAVKRFALETVSAGVNVVALGADPTGAADSAPAFRAAMDSNSLIIVPPGSYLFKTIDTAPFTPHNAGVNIDSLDNFAILGYGATITMDTGVSSYSTFVITRCSNFQVYGLTFANTGMGLFSDVNFHISDLTFGTAVTAQAFFGDYLIDGTIDHITVKHGQAIDMAYITHMRFNDWRCDGGNTTASNLCIGISGDTASAGLNETGVTIDQSDDVSFTNNNITGYATGALLREGKNYKFRGNQWHELNHTSIAPVCISIAYSTDATTPSSGFPVRGVIIDGDSFTGYGATTPGYGVLINATNITTASTDKIADITISNCQFLDGSFAGVNTVSSSTSHIENFTLGAGNSFRGASLSQPMFGFDSFSIIGGSAGTPVLTSIVTVAALATGAPAGSRAFVTNASTGLTFASSVTSSTASIAIPVYSDGTIWRVG